MLDSIWSNSKSATASLEKSSSGLKRSIASVTNNNNKTNNINVYNTNSSYDSSRDMELTMRKMAFSIL